jgi:hypothetical protein
MFWDSLLDDAAGECAMYVTMGATCDQASVIAQCG